ncbi:MAG TPA: ATP-binding protein, partial [Candidatus Wallbacteria bacterium]|nr:ATP-binding protein [Candidatus Wallbacteria bacterium]
DGNYDLLIQAFYNILLNCVQAVSEMIEKSGEYMGLLTISESLGEKTADITFADNGGGIAPQALERIFDAGYSTKTGGSGLGLAIVSEIVKQHGAVINIESGGTETKVKISFPLSEGELK